MLEMIRVVPILNSDEIMNIRGFEQNMIKREDKEKSKLSKWIV